MASKHANQKKPKKKVRSERTSYSSALGKKAKLEAHGSNGFLRTDESSSLLHDDTVAPAPSLDYEPSRKS